MVRFRFPCVGCHQSRAPPACAIAIASATVAVSATPWQAIAGPGPDTGVYVVDRSAADEPARDCLDPQAKYAPARLQPLFRSTPTGYRVEILPLVQCHANIDRACSPGLQRTRIPVPRAATGCGWVLFHIALGAILTRAPRSWGYSEISQEKTIGDRTGTDAASALAIETWRQADRLQRRKPILATDRSHPT